MQGEEKRLALSPPGTAEAGGTGQPGPPRTSTRRALGRGSEGACSWWRRSSVKSEYNGPLTLLPPKTGEVSPQASAGGQHTQSRLQKLQAHASFLHGKHGILLIPPQDGDSQRAQGCMAAVLRWGPRKIPGTGWTGWRAGRAGTEETAELVHQGPALLAQSRSSELSPGLPVPGPHAGEGTGPWEGSAGPG